MRRLVDALMQSPTNATIICAPPNYLHLPNSNDHDQRNLSRSSRKTNGLRVIRTKTISAKHSLLLRMLDQTIFALSGATAGIIEGTLFKRPPTCVFATVPTLPTALSGYIVARWFRVPFIIDLRDAWPELTKSLDSWRPPQDRRTFRQTLSFRLVGLGVRLGGFLFELLLRRANRIITTSAALTNHLKSGGYDEVVTIRNAYAENHWRTDLTRHRSPKFEHGGELKVLYAGTIGRAQGLENAIGALELAKRQGAKVRLRIIGSGAEMGLVRQRAKELGTSVEILERVPQTMMNNHYAWCDTCLIHLRDWPALKLTIPSKLIEVMSRGIPACVSANGEPADIVRSTGAGATVPAMQPEALAELWVEWSRTGPPTPNHALIRHWILNHADPQTTAKQFVEAVLGATK